VDREQRPDVDAVYMNAVQMMTGSGGWPLSVFLTPEGKPFYGGTYFPLQDSFGRAGFERVLVAIAEAWQQKRGELVESAGRITELLSTPAVPSEQGKLSFDMPARAYTQLAGIFDDTHGGFGGAPKFPQPGSLLMLLRYWYRSGDEKALQMVTTTLDAMANGGIYDHIGGGFHRYSTDARWLVPHFEKMLYDQALLSRSYIEAYQVTGKESFAAVAGSIFDYVLRDMTDPQGGFYSAEDADSEGKEGLFYLWESSEITELLGGEKARIFSEYYDVTEKGNFEDGKSILNVTGAIDKLTGWFGRDRSDIERTLAESRKELLRHRGGRVRPGRDDKVITAWNGLMISSMAYGGSVLHEDKYIAAAKRAAEFVLNRLRQDGRLLRYYRDGKAVGPAFLDDYAFVIMGLLDLYEATFEARWLAEAKESAEQMMELYGSEDGGFYLSAEDSDRLIVRNKSAYDGALPSGNSVAALALLRLGRMTMERRYTEQAEQVLQLFSGQMRQSPASSTFMLTAVDFHLGSTQEIVIAGVPAGEDTEQMLRFIRGRFLPSAVVLFHPTGSAGEAIEKLVPFVKGQVAIGGKATAYVCENFVCRQPVNTVSELKKLLTANPEGGGRQK